MTRFLMLPLLALLSVWMAIPVSGCSHAIPIGQCASAAVEEAIRDALAGEDFETALAEMVANGTALSTIQCIVSELLGMGAKAGADKLTSHARTWRDRHPINSLLQRGPAVGRLAHNQEIAGSTPAAATTPLDSWAPSLGKAVAACDVACGAADGAVLSSERGCLCWRGKGKAGHWSAAGGSAFLSTESTAHCELWAGHEPLMVCW